MEKRKSRRCASGIWTLVRASATTRSRTTPHDKFRQGTAGAGPCGGSGVAADRRFGNGLRRSVHAQHTAGGSPPGCFAAAWRNEQGSRSMDSGSPVRYVIYGAHRSARVPDSGSGKFPGARAGVAHQLQRTQCGYYGGALGEPCAADPSLPVGSSERFRGCYCTAFLASHMSSFTLTRPNVWDTLVQLQSRSPFAITSILPVSGALQFIASDAICDLPISSAR